MLRFNEVLANLPLLVSGFLLTVQVAAGAMVLGIALGLVAAIARMSGLAPLRWIAGTYIEIIRNTPALVQLFIIYYGLSELGLRLPAVPSLILALGINNGAYLAEIFRGGLQSVRRGQLEAAAAIGLSEGVAFTQVVLPQAVRTMVPATTNQCIQIVLATSLGTVVGRRRAHQSVDVHQLPDVPDVGGAHHPDPRLRPADLDHQPHRAGHQLAPGTGVSLMDFTFLEAYPRVLLDAALLTITLSVVCLLGGLSIGLLVAVLRTLGGRIVNTLLGIVVDLIRGTPLLVQLLIWYLAPSILNIDLSQFEAVVVGLSVNAGAFISEIDPGWHPVVAQGPARGGAGARRVAHLLPARHRAAPGDAPDAAGDGQLHHRAHQGHLHRLHHGPPRAAPIVAVHRRLRATTLGDLHRGGGHLLRHLLPAVAGGRPPGDAPGSVGDGPGAPLDMNIPTLQGGPVSESSCAPLQVVTVRGPIDPSEMGRPCHMTTCSSTPSTCGAQ